MLGRKTRSRIREQFEHLQGDSTPASVAIRFASAAAAFYAPCMERIAHKARTFAEAEAWDRKQYRAMSPVERMRVAREIKKRVFPGKQPDVREWHRNR